MKINYRDIGYVYLEDNFTLYQASRLLRNGMSAEDILYFLFEQGIIDSRCIPFPEYRTKGYMFHINSLYPKGSSSPRKIHIPYFTPAGIEWFKNLVGSNK
jgi:hypothetical protein